jgi:hypothetical protein
VDGKPYSPAVAAVAGWLLPGLGHVYVGERTRGLFLMAALVSTFALGAALGHFQNVWWTADRWLEVGCQVWAGGPAVAMFAVTAHWPPANAPGVTEPRHFNRTARIGTLCTQIVGLLNLLLFTDAGVRAYRKNQAAAGGQKAR